MVIIYLKSVTSRQEIKSGAWMPALILSVLALSYFGSFGLDVLIPFPEDLIVLVIIGLFFHYIAVKSGIKTKAIEEIIDNMKGLI